MMDDIDMVEGNNMIESVPVRTYNGNKRSRTVKIIAITCAATFFLVTIFYAVAVTYLLYDDVSPPSNATTMIEPASGSVIDSHEHHAPNSNPAMVCQIKKPSINIHSYPSRDKFTYVIDFNETISQANYVYYISMPGGNSESSGWKKDPYDINKLRASDYTGTGYDKGHLVPNADYGADTFYITNAVPMVPNFNRGVWAVSERHIRSEYAGKLVYKGCEYDEQIPVNGKLYIPKGCYYIVFDSPVLTDLAKNTIGPVLDYGYYENSANSVKQYRLPAWAFCNNIRLTTENGNALINRSPLASSRMKVFSTPGMYILNPSDYDHSENIIVEAWGGGGSGNCFSTGGGSGGYVQALIQSRAQSSDDQRSFTLRVGRGGMGSMCPGTTGSNGEQTYINSGGYRIFAAGNGKIGGLTTNNIVGRYNHNNILSIDGQNGLHRVCSHKPCHGGNGGSAPRGGNGGNGGDNWNPVRDGQNPGGGGGGISAANLLSGNGGNGTIIVYY